MYYQAQRVVNMEECADQNITRVKKNKGKVLSLGEEPAHAVMQAEGLAV